MGGFRKNQMAQAMSIVETLLVDFHSAYQHLIVFKFKTYGNVLVLTE